MVILEGSAMLQVGNNQYLQPDYLSPLPTTLDAKKSPLALLAQTCSQIGADPGNITVKSLVSPSEKNKKSSSANSNSSGGASSSSSTSNSSASSQVDPTSNSSSLSRPPSVKTEKSDASPEIKLGFKPYELNVLTSKVNLSKASLADERPSSKMSSGSDMLNNNSVSQINNNNNNNNHHHHHHHQQHGDGGRKDGRALSPCGSADSPLSGRGGGSASVKSNDSGSGSGSMGDHGGNKCSTPDANRRASSAGTPSDRERMSVGGGGGGGGGPGTSSSPSAGMMAMHKEQHPGQLPPSAAYKQSAYGMSAGLPSPSGIDHTNPAFRPPFAGAFNHHHAAMLAAAGYSGAAAAAAAASAASANPYLGYTRVKTPSGGETLVPICKDPYCTGCQFSAHNHQMLMGSQCPAGCTQCDHQKYMAMALSSMPPAGYSGYPHPSSSAAAAAAAVAAAANNGMSQQSGGAGAASRPYMCNWVVGDSYCGKRCNTTDELLSHLRTHTANLSDPAALALQQQLMPLSGIFPPTSLHHHHRGYPNPPLSPLSAARYHPYAKPGAMPTGMPGSPYSAAAVAAAAFNPAAAFGQYYSPYAAALYGQRMGAAVHQ